MGEALTCVVQLDGARVRIVSAEAELEVPGFFTKKGCEAWLCVGIWRQKREPGLEWTL